MTEPKRSSSTRSWRGGAKATANYDGPSNAARIFWTAAFLGLIGGLAWWLWWPTKPEAQFAAAGITYDKITPIPFCDEDAAAFAKLAPDKDVREKEVRSDTISRIWEKDGRPDRPFIVYLAARGVSDAEGTAWLLCSDCQQEVAGALGSRKGYYKLQEVLAGLKTHKAPLKLLILDVSYAQSSSGGGLLINEFPSLVEEEVKKIDDETLWVMTNSRSLEGEHFCETDRRSVFGYFVMEGLRGEAAFAQHGKDAKPRHGGIVDLDDLYDFVLRGVGEWVQKNGGGLESQTPCLYHGGDGLVHQVPSGRHLRAVTDRGQPATPVAAAADGEAASPKPAENDDFLRALGALADAWQQHDNLQQPTPCGWAIGDFAPQVWRAYEDVLLDYEFRLRCGQAHANRITDLTSKVIAVLKPDPAADCDADPSDDPIIDLQRTRCCFKKRQEDLLAWAQKNPPLFNAFQAQSRGVSMAAHGIRWHRAILGCELNGEYSARVEQIGEQIGRLLSALQNLSKNLSAVMRGSGNSSLNRASVQNLEAATNEVNKEVTDLYKSWKTEAGELARAKSPAIGRAARIEALLAVPALNADDRIALLKMRRTLDLPLVFPEELPARTFPKTVCEPSASFMIRIADQAKWEREITMLAVPTAKIDLPKFEIANPDKLPRQCERFAKQLIDAQAEIAGRASELSGLLTTGSQEPKTVAALDQLLPWIDAHEGKRLFFIIPPLAAGPPQAPKVTVELVEKEPRSSDPYKSTRLYRVKVTVLGTTATEAEFSWDRGNFKLADDLEVFSFSGQRHPLAAGVWENIALANNSGEVDLSLDFKNALSKGPLDGAVKVKARAADYQPDEKPIALHVPALDVVRVIEVDAEGREIGHPTGLPKPILLRPFPNRQTEFLLKVKNESEVDKDLSIEFVTPSEWKASEKNWEDSLRQAGAKLPDGLSQVFAPIPLKVPAGKSESIPFPAAAATAPAAAAAAPAAAAMPPAPGENITNGLAVLIREGSDPSKIRVQRIEFNPWKPSDFLDADFKYDTRRQELNVTLKPKDEVPFPSVSKKNPVMVHFASDPAGVSGDDVIEARSNPAVFDKRITSDFTKGPLRFYFDVDTYPHALQYVFPDWSHQPDKFEPDERVMLNITSPKPNAAFDASLDNRPEKVPLTFEVYGGTEFLHHFDAHAKVNDKIEIVTLDQEGADIPPWTRLHPKLFSTRQQEITICGSHANGGLEVMTRVGKFKAPLELDLPKQKVSIEVSAAYPNFIPRYGPASPYIETLPIILDERPAISIFSPAEKAEKIEIKTGQGLPVELKVISLSEITQFDCGFDDPKNPGHLAKDPKEVKVNQRPDGIWWVKAPTEKLPAGDYTLHLLFQAANKVGDAIRQRDVFVVITDPVVAAGPVQPAAKIGTIKGDFVFMFNRNEKCTSGKVQLDDGKAKNIKDDGTFEFDNVPYGPHKLSAEGSKSGGKYKGTLDFQLDAQTDSQPQSIELQP